MKLNQLLNFDVLCAVLNHTFGASWVVLGFVGLRHLIDYLVTDGNTAKWLNTIESLAIIGTFMLFAARMLYKVARLTATADKAHEYKAVVV